MSVTFNTNSLNSLSTATTTTTTTNDYTHPDYYSVGGNAYVDKYGNGFVRDQYGNYIYTGSSSSYVHTAPIAVPQPPQPQGSNVNSRTGTVQVKAGFVGQVFVTDPVTAGKVILWESKPKKTLAKGDKAAKKAQLRAAQRSFE